MLSLSMHTNANPSKFLKPILSSFKSVAITLFIGSSLFTLNASAADDGFSELKQVMKGQLAMMKPELQKEVSTLSTDTKMMLMSILAMHSRNSDRATLRQVMLEVLADYQTIVIGIMTNSSEMASDAARRLANHRIPVGGLLPYMGLENINDDRLAVLASFNDSVEGNANKLAEAADNGDMATAGALLGKINTGCVGCHTVFRAEPIGKSDLLR